MASTKNADTLTGPQPHSSQGQQAGSQHVGLRQIGEHLARAAQAVPSGGAAPDAAAHLWRNATPIP